MEVLLAAALLGASEGIKPGPLNTVVIAETLKHDWKAGAKVAASPLITDAPIISISALIWWSAAQVNGVVTGLYLIGAVYLLWLAIDGFRIKEFRTEENQSGSTDSLRRGVLTNILNPNAWLFWTLAGAPFLAKGFAESPLMPLLFIGGFLGCLIAVKVGIAIAVGRSKTFLSGRGIIWGIRASSLTLLLLAAHMLREVS